MNEQHAPNGIEWTRIRKADGTYTKGYTWNVLGDQSVPVFYKGNMRINQYARSAWRDDFPTSYRQRGFTGEAVVQAVMFGEDA